MKIYCNRIHDYKISIASITGYLCLCFLLIFFWRVGLVQAVSPNALGNESGFMGNNIQENPTSKPFHMFIGVGDSLTHGTMDATNNWLNTINAYLHRVAISLHQEIPLYFMQPYFDFQEDRLNPYQMPTNLGVDGADIFSVVGLEYYKRVGATESFYTTDLLADKTMIENFQDKYDKVLFPINLYPPRLVSQLSSAIWLIHALGPWAGFERPLVVFWLGNNDSSLAALGLGGSNPNFQPLPYDAIKSELNPLLSILLAFARESGALSFEPYTQASIERNLTDLLDFEDQYRQVLDLLDTEFFSSGVIPEIFLLTLPYYSSVGYLMDSEDIEYYFKKIAPAYSVPVTFKRVAPPGEPIAEPLKGDRIPFFTFGLMYTLLSTGHTIEEVNQVLDKGGVQQDGIVLSEEEQQFIMSRIDSYNATIKTLAASKGTNVHVVDIGDYLNSVLTGKIQVTIDGRVFNRKWVRGGAFTFDGVHPGYTGQALIANFLLDHINHALEINTPPIDLSAVLGTDPYIDKDGDGWAPGPTYQASGITDLLFSFKDPDDNNPAVQAELQPNIWDKISDILLKEISVIPRIQTEAQRLGLLPQSK